MSNTGLFEDFKSIQFGTYSEIFEKFKALSEQYGGLPMDSLLNAFGSVSMTSPYIHNRRVKAISSLPAAFSKSEVADMVKDAEDNEQSLRQVAHALEYTAYPMFHTRKVYQELLSYHNYIVPQFVDKNDVKTDLFWREYKLVEKLREAFEVKSIAHQIVGSSLQEGKIFYYPRYKIDKSHNKVEYALMQQLPSDYIKIVGFNNKSKYTLAFNMMYFAQPGTSVLQFGDLFIPYINSFSRVVSKPDTKTAFASSKPSVNLEKFKKISADNQLYGDPQAYYQNGKWFYWVTLPVDRVFTFEVDDTSRTVVSPFVGLFVDMIQLAQYGQLQLELLQNPLVSVVLGEIPYYDEKVSDKADQYMLSNAGRKLFEKYWYDMMAANNTSGIGLYLAPAKNLKLESLSEAPNAMDIVSQGYTDTISKAGLTGIIPTSDETRAGLAQISLQIESKFGEPIYRCFERMFKCIFEQLSLKYDFKFTMFGNLATDAEEEKSLRNDMTLGILPATLRYMALRDMSIFDDMSISSAIAESGVLDMRLPLVSSYSAKQDKSQLPPQIAHEQDPGGRPSSDGQATSEGAEADID